MLAIIHADLVMPDHIIPDGFVQLGGAYGIRTYFRYI